MEIKSTFRFILIFIRFVVVSIEATVLLLVLLYVAYENMPSFGYWTMTLFVYLLIGLGVLGTIYQIISLRDVLFAITVNEKGIKQKFVLGIGSGRFYLWSELSGYDTKSYSLATAVSFNVVKVFKNKRCIIRIDEATHGNFDVLKAEVEKYLNSYPDGAK
jgi:hypothetical protein